MAVGDQQLEQLRVLEQRFWVVGGGNPDFWREHFAEDGLVLLPLGIMGKEQTVAAMGSARPWTHVEMTELELRGLGDDQALLAYSAQAARDGDAEDYRAVVASLYVRRGQRWQLYCHQQSPEQPS